MSTAITKAPRTRKPKLCYTSNEIAHVWANEGAPEGKSPGNMHFSGTQFYSYGTCIARILHTKKKERVYVVDMAGFSVSTSSHQSAVRGAISRDAHKFFVREGRRGQGLRFTPEELRDHYLDAFNDKGELERLAWQNAGRIGSRYHNLDEALRVCEVFGLPTKDIKALLRKGKEERNEAREIVLIHEVAQSKKRKEREAKREAVAIAKAEAYAQHYLGNADEVKYRGAQNLLGTHRPELWAQVEGVIKERNAGAMRAWQDGTTNEHEHSWPVMLRREGDEMVTSKGARVPIADAERAYKFASKVRAKGWRANGEQCRVGIYKLDAVTSEGVICGCHRVSWSEILRFAQQQNWYATIHRPDQSEVLPPDSD